MDQTSWIEKNTPQNSQNCSSNQSQSAASKAICKTIGDVRQALPSDCQHITIEDSINDPTMLNHLYNFMKLPSGQSLLREIDKKIVLYNQLAGDLASEGLKIEHDGICNQCQFSSKSFTVNLFLPPSELQMRRYPLLVRNEPDDEIGLISYQPPLEEIIGHELGHALGTLENKILYYQLNPLEKEAAGESNKYITPDSFDEWMLERRAQNLLGKIVEPSSEEFTAEFTFRDLWNHGHLAECINILPENIICPGNIDYPTSGSPGDAPFAGSKSAPSIPERTISISDGVFLQESLQMIYNKDAVLEDSFPPHFFSVFAPDNYIDDEDKVKEAITKASTVVLRIGHGQFTSAEVSTYSVCASLRKLNPREIDKFYGYLRKTVECCQREPASLPPVSQGVYTAAEAKKANSRKWNQDKNENVEQIKSFEERFNTKLMIAEKLRKKLVLSSGENEEPKLIKNINAFLAVAKKVLDLDPSKQNEQTLRSEIIQCQKALDPRSGVGSFFTRPEDGSSSDDAFEDPKEEGWSAEENRNYQELICDFVELVSNLAGALQNAITYKYDPDK